MFTLNADYAVEGSEMGGAGIIDTSGAYVGAIKEAKMGRGNGGAEYLELSFERNDGAKANYIKLYTKKNDGSEGFGVKQIHALMTVMKLRQVTDLSQLNQPVGLVLQREDYTKQNGETGFTMKLIAPFNHQTRQTAAELIQQRQAETIGKIVENLVDKKAKPITQQPGGYQPQHQQAQQEFSGDIPF